MNEKTNPLGKDLDFILQHTEELWEEIRGKRIFITGGTGFFGKWILESFIWINDTLDLKAEAFVLTRNYELFKNSFPHLAINKYISFQIGDIRNFKFLDGEFPYIIHLASASADGYFKKEDPVLRLDTIVNGTKRLLDFAVKCNAKKILFTSSGKIYGIQPPDITHIPEDYDGAVNPDDPNAALGIGKRAAEFLCITYAKSYGIEIKIARCFSFVGPYLQLNLHYAIGNFIRDGLIGGPIIVKGDGTPYRSYMYASDLTVWLWTILFKGQSCRPYNVGAEEAITIADLARLVASCFDKPIEVKIMKKPDPNIPPERYVPSTKRAREELGLRQNIPLEESILKTIEWYKKFKIFN